MSEDLIQLIWSACRKLGEAPYEPTKYVINEVQETQLLDSGLSKDDINSHFFVSKRL